MSRDDFLNVPELAVNPLGDRIVDAFFTLAYVFILVVYVAKLGCRWGRGQSTFLVLFIGEFRYPLSRIADRAVRKWTQNVKNEYTSLYLM